MKVFGRLASSPLKLPLAPVLPDVVKELATFLRKQNRQLKQACFSLCFFCFVYFSSLLFCFPTTLCLLSTLCLLTFSCPLLSASFPFLLPCVRALGINLYVLQASLSTLEIIVRNYGKEKAVAALFPNVLTELSPLISDVDLHITQLSLGLAVAMLKASPDAAANVRDMTYPKAVELVQSSLLQGQALQALLSLFAELVAIQDKKLTYDVLLDSLLSLTKKQLPKQCYSSIAQAAAVVAASTSDTGKREATVSRFVKDVQVYTCTFLHTHTHTTHMHTHTHMHTLTSHTHMHTHARTRAYAHTRIHTGYDR